MILADTSVWIQHLRAGLPAFADALEQETICTHWIVVGELACGHLPRRSQSLADLQTISRARTATPEECLRFAVACGAESTQHFGAGVVQPREVGRLRAEVQVETLEAPAVEVGR